jgi:uncharacterized protein (UPF0297 family)
MGAKKRGSPHQVTQIYPSDQIYAPRYGDARNVRRGHTRCRVVPQIVESLAMASVPWGLGKGAHRTRATQIHPTHQIYVPRYGDARNARHGYTRYRVCLG